MIPQIREINFPEYATLHQATVNLSTMGDRTITTQIRVDGSIAPAFGITENGVFKPMELEFRGERFILPTREPQARKDNTTKNSLIDLTFYSWPVYELKRYFFVEMSSTTSGTAIADKYDASLALNLENFVDAFNLVLDHYFNGRIQISLFGQGQGIYSTDPVFFEINYTKLWEVLQKVYEMYNVRWWFDYDSASGIYLIKMGYTADSIDDHDFSYGYKGGLLSFERTVQSDDLVNIILGRGGEKNLPYRYFKRTDPGNPGWTADPDAIPELANIYFDRLHDVNFRWYVRGWMTNPTPNRDRSWEQGGYVYPTYSIDSDSPYYFAYQKGATDAKFNPVEYVKDDESIAAHGEVWGALDDNDDIYPTIQGVTVNPYGRIDEAVAISQIETDDISAYASAAAVETTIKDMYVSEQGNTVLNYTVYSKPFTIAQGEIGNVTYRPFSKETVYPNFVYYDTTRSTLVAEPLSGGSDQSGTASYDESTGLYAVSGIPAGTYRLKLNLVLRIDSPATAVNGTFGIENVVLTTSAANTNAWKPTFDIWVKNLWQTTQGANESNKDYAERVWGPILGDRLGDEAKIVFSTGAMSISQDYEFVIADYPVPDRTKTLNGVRSEWKITVYKSDAEYQATGLYIPNASSTQPRAGDKFFFVGIDMPFQYVEWAEERLNQYKTDNLNGMSEISPTWTLKLDKVRINSLEDEDYGQKLADRLDAGVMIRTTDPRFTHGDILSLYIQSITWTWNEPSKGNPYIVPDVEVILADKVSAVESPISRLENDVDVISQTYVQSGDVEAVVRRVAGALYLKKTGESDSSSSPTTFSSKVTSRNFRKGGIGGAGWGLYEDNSRKFSQSSPATRADVSDEEETIEPRTVLEVDRLVVREEMEVNNLVINQISARGGREIISAARIETTLVRETDTSYVCYFDQKQNSIANLFRVNDIAYGQVWSADNTELRFYKMLVTAVDVNSITLAKTGSYGSGFPQEGDVIVQYGNTTDPSRQYVIIRDVIGGGHDRMLSGLNSVSAEGVEYYYAGVETGDTPRWFVGDRQSEYAEYKNGQLNIKGRLSVLKSDGTYQSMAEFITQIADDEQNLQEQIDGLSYLKSATNSGVTLVDGGLILSNLMALGKTEEGTFNIYSGINGIMDANAYGNGIAAWYGGPMIDHEAAPGTAPYANSLFRFDGSGYLAGGLLKWGVNNGEAFLTLNGEAVVGGLGGTTLNDIANLMFEVVEYKTGHYAAKLKTRAYYGSSLVTLDGLYAEGWISAGGVSDTGGGGGGGGSSYLRDLLDVDDDIDSTSNYGKYLYYDGTLGKWTAREASGTPVTEETVAGWGFTKNTGTVTQVKVGTTAYNPSDGVVSLPAYPTTLPASDVSAWAKASTKPSYSFSEITGTASASQIPTLSISKISGLQSALDNKQPLDSDLTAIAALTGTSGLLRKTSGTWGLDTASYVTTSALDDYLPLTAGSSKPLTGALYIKIPYSSSQNTYANYFRFINSEDTDVAHINVTGQGHLGLYANRTIEFMADGTRRFIIGATSTQVSEKKAGFYPEIDGTITLNSTGALSALGNGYNVGKSDKFIRATYSKVIYLTDSAYIYYDTVNDCIRTNTPVASDSWISAGGVSNTGGGGGGGASYLRELNDVDDNLSPASGNALVFDGTKWTAKPIDLSGYLSRSGGSMTNSSLVTNLNADYLDGRNGSWYAWYNEETNGDNVDYNTISYDKNCTILVQPIHVNNYTGQTNYPFTGYGQMLTFGGHNSLFPFRIAHSNSNNQLWYQAAGYITTSTFDFSANREWKRIAFADELGGYLPLTGGTLTGNLFLTSGAAAIYISGSGGSMLYGSTSTFGNIGQTVIGQALGNTYLRGQNNPAYRKYDSAGNYQEYTMWHSGNDGAGSGLDADLLDGKHLAEILASNVASATKLETARTIWGQNFNGTANVNGKFYFNNGDGTLKIYDVVSPTASYGLESVAIQTAFDQQDPETSAYPGTYGSRCLLLLQPRGGRVGIGRTDPGHELDVAGTIRATNTIYMPQIEFKGMSASAAHGGYIDFHYNNSTDDFTSRIIEGASGKININNTLYAIYNGTVGIGTSSPSTSYKLDVNGSARIAGTLTSQAIKPSTTSTSQSTGYDLGASNAFWKNTYTRRIYLADGIYVYYDSDNQCIRTNAPIASDSWISAGGVSTT